MADQIFSDADMGIGSAPAPAGSPSASPLTVTPPPATPAPSASSSSSGLLSDADMGIGSTPVSSSSTGPSGGVLSNSSNDGWLSGAVKGLASDAVRAPFIIPGMFGSAMDMADNLVAHGQSYLTGEDVGSILQRQAQDRANDWTDPRNYLPSTDQLAAPVLSKTGDYQPTTVVGRVAQAGALAAMGGLAGGEGSVTNIASNGWKAGSKAIGTAAIPNAVAGATGQLAAESAADPNDAALLGLVGAVAGGHVGGVASKAAGLGRGAAVGTMLQDASSDPAALRSNLGVNGTVDGASSVAIPGVVPTTGQVAGDAGLLRAENDARTANNVAWNARDASNNSAMLDAFGRMQPDGANAMVPANFARSSLSAIDDAATQAADQLQSAHDAAVDQLNSNYNAGSAARSQAQGDFIAGQNGGLADRTAARGQDLADANMTAAAGQQAASDRLTQAFADRMQQLQAGAQDAAGQLGPRVNPEDAGNMLRGALSASDARSDALTSSLYKAVNPDGTLNAVVSPLKEAAAKIAGSIDPTFGVQPSGAEAAIHSAIAASPDVIPFNSLQTIDSRITAAMRDARRNPNPNDPQALSRLTQLKGASMDAINNMVENQRAYENRAASLGINDPDDTIESRLAEWARDPQAYAGTGGDERGAAYGTANSEPAASSGFPGTASQGGRGFDDPAGSPGVPEAALRSEDVVPRPAPPVEPRPQDLVSFVRSRGGMTDPTGDLRSLGLADVRGMVSKNGMHPDRMREAAAEAGYLGADTAHAVANTSVDDLLDHLAADRPVYSVHDDDLVHRWNAYDMQRGEWQGQRGQTRLTPSMPPGRPLASYTEADMYPGGMAPSDLRAGSLKPNADPGVADRLAAAKAASADGKQTFDQGPVGEVLKTNGFKGQFATQDGRVAANAVRQGPQGYETAKAFLKAAGDDPRGAEAMRQVALNPLREGLMPDGSVSPAKYAAWRQNYDGAIRALDESDPGFANRYKSAADATQAMMDEGARQKAALVEHRNGQAAQALVDMKSRKAATGAADDADKASVQALIAERKASDVAAERVADSARKAGIADARATLKAGKAQTAGFVRQAKQSPLAEFAGRSVPSEVENVMGSMLVDKKSGPTNMRRLVDQVRDNPEALEGLRKAAYDYLGRTFLNNAEAGTTGNKALSSAKLQGFLRDNRATLQALVPEKSMNTLQAMAAAQARQDRTWSVPGNKGQSATSKNLHALVSKAADHGHLAGQIGLWQLGEHAFEHLTEHGVTPESFMMAAGAGAAYATAKVRSREAAIRQAMFTDALMNPDRAAHYLKQVPADARGGAFKPLANSLRRSLITAPIVMRQQDRATAAARDGFAHGGAPQRVAGASGRSKAWIEARADELHQQLQQLAVAMSATGSVGSMPMGVGLR